MNEKRIKRQYGLWDSPISSRSLGRGLNFRDVQWDQSGSLVWLENRSDRGVLMVQPAEGGAARELNSEYSVRARVGYGGGDFYAGNGWVYFAEAKSGRLYRQPIDSGTAKPVTPAFGNSASPKLSPDGKWLLFVRTYEDQDTLEIVDAAGEQWPQKLVSGEDFYMQPVWSPSGDKIAWIAWDHPNMPWDGTYLRSGKLSFDVVGYPLLKEVVTLAGDDKTSIFQPEFSPDGRYLAYVSDQSGWWQIYLRDLENGEVRQVTKASAEHGVPGWAQGMRTYGFSSDGKQIYFTRNNQGIISLWQYDLASAEEEQLLKDEAYSFMDQISPGPGGIAMIASGGNVPSRLITYTPAVEKGIGAVSVIRRGTSEELPGEAYSQPEPIEWKGMDDGTAYGLFYSPNNMGFEGIGKPPLVVAVHGCPTGQAKTDFDPRSQYLTSRGYAVLDVNYRGSAGFGREYRNKLQGNWGIFDVQDSVSGAQFLVDQGRVDAKRIVIMGGSAGGFTVLKALEDYPGFFTAGICLFGVSNQFTLAANTHKFETHYSVSLIGPLPEASDLYRERSPIFFVDQIKDPIAVFQGEDDVVVPRAQSDEVVASLERRGIPHVYHVYPGEGHGFRKSETIEHFFNEVEKFLTQYVIFT